MKNIFIKDINSILPALINDIKQLIVIHENKQLPNETIILETIEDEEKNLKVAEESLSNIQKIEKYLNAIKNKLINAEPLDENIISEIYIKNVLRKIPAINLINSIIIGLITAVIIIIFTPVKIFSAVILAILGLAISLVILPIGFERKNIFNCVILLSMVLAMILTMEKLVLTGNIIQIILAALLGFSIGAVLALAGVALFLFSIFGYYIISSRTLEEALELIDKEKDLSFEREIQIIYRKKLQRINEVINLLDKMEVKKLN
ncbi:MAG: hypothetical protein AB1782_18605 [Cyanobacteriota bacterium]